MSSEKRKFRRIPANFDLLYRINDPSSVRTQSDRKKQCTHLFDISEIGMAISSDAPLVRGTELDISFHLIYRDSQTPQMDVKGLVCYCTAALFAGKNCFRVGIHFTEIADEDRRAITDFIKTRSSSARP